MRYVEYSDHSSPNEIRCFLSQLSFSQVIGLSIQLPQNQTEELERLSLMDFSDMLTRTEMDENIVGNELSGLASSTVRNRFCGNFASQIKVFYFKKRLRIKEFFLYDSGVLEDLIADR